MNARSGSRLTEKPADPGPHVEFRAVFMKLIRFLPITGFIVLLVPRPPLHAEAAQAPLAGRSLLQQIDAGFVEVFEKVGPAVVVIEAYDRIVAREPGLSLQEAMLKAADEMVGPMVGGTLTIVVVFLPFSLLARQTQILFAGISFVVTASLFASLFVALTLVPALGARMSAPPSWPRS